MPKDRRTQICGHVRGIPIPFNGPYRRCQMTVICPKFSFKKLKLRCVCRGKKESSDTAVTTG